MLVDRYRAKIEELVERSGGRVRADVVHVRLRDLDPEHPYTASERTTRRAVRAAKAAYRAGHRRTYRPWVTEPGMWLQFDWGAGPMIGGRPTLLFCAWLAWSRFRVVIPTWDRTLGSLLACLDATLRALGGAPTYALTDNERTITIERIAGIGVRHPEIVAAGRHYGIEVNACVPFDPQSKGGSESTVKIAKADLVPTEANLLGAYADFTDLAAACAAFCAQVNARVHRETGRRPDDLLAIERAHLHVLPGEPYTAALGATRSVGDDQTIRLGSVRYSVPRAFVGAEVWVRVAGDEVVIVARTPDGLAEIARHPRSTPGRPGSTTPTTRTIRTVGGPAEPGRDRSIRRSGPSSPWVPAPRPGSSRRPRRARSGCGPRWPGRSSSRRSSAGSGSRRPSRSRPGQDASPRPTSPRSSTISPLTSPAER